MKTAIMVKRLAKEKNISVREAERWLDAARPTSRSSGSRHPAGFTKNIYAKWCFHHAAATSKCEH